MTEFRIIFGQALPLNKKSSKKVSYGFSSHISFLNLILFFELLLRGNCTLGNRMRCSFCSRSENDCNSCRAPTVTQDGDDGGPDTGARQNLSQHSKAHFSRAKVLWHGPLTDLIPRNPMTANTALRTHRKGCMTESPITIHVVPVSCAFSASWHTGQKALAALMSACILDDRLS